jgi:hypothetical protein
VRRFSRDDLGSLVLDTQRHCFGLYGFLGVYATVGLPRVGQTPDVAFQIPIIYNGWNGFIIPRSCMVAAHRHTFMRLQAALGFTPPIYHRVTQIPRGSSTLEVVYASLGSYENLGCFNPRLLPAQSTAYPESVKGRTVFFVEG